MRKAPLPSKPSTLSSAQNTSTTKPSTVKKPTTATATSKIKTEEPSSAKASSLTQISKAQTDDSTRTKPPTTQPSKIKMEEPVSFSINPRDIERPLKEKIDTQNKTITKLKADLKDVKSDRDRLNVEMNQNAALLREAFAKLDTGSNFAQRRIFLLKSRMLQQQKTISILTRNLKTFQTLYNEYWGQLTHMDTWLDQIKSNPDPSTIKNMSVEKTIQSFKSRLEELKSNCSYEYSQSVRTESVRIDLYEDLNEIYANNQTLINTRIKDRFALEESLYELHQKLSELIAAKKNDKNSPDYNLMSYLSEKSRNLVEFFILEGFNPAKMSNLYTKKNCHSHIEENFASMERLISKVQHNRDAMHYIEDFEGVRKALVGEGKRKNVDSLYGRYIELAEEDKSKKIFKSKEFLEFIEKIKAVDRTEKYLMEGQISILQAFLARLVLKLEDLEDFYVSKLTELRDSLQGDLLEPFGDLMNTFQSYQNENCNPALSVNLVNIFQVHHTKIRRALGRLMGLGKSTASSQDQFLDIKSLVEAFQQVFQETADSI